MNIRYSFLYSTSQNHNEQVVEEKRALYKRLNKHGLQDEEQRYQDVLSNSARLPSPPSPSSSSFDRTKRGNSIERDVPRSQLDKLLLEKHLREDLSTIDSRIGKYVLFVELISFVQYSH